MLPLHQAHEYLGGPVWITLHRRIRFQMAGDRSYGAIVFSRNALNFHRGSGPIGGKSTRLDCKVTNAEGRGFGGKNSGEPVDCELRSLIRPETRGTSDPAS